MEDASIKNEISWELYVDMNPSNENPLEGKRNAIARRSSLCFQNCSTEKERRWHQMLCNVAGPSPNCQNLLRAGLDQLPEQQKTARQSKSVRQTLQYGFGKCKGDVDGGECAHHACILWACTLVDCC
jgi:hypothetical protein